MTIGELIIALQALDPGMPALHWDGNEKYAILNVEDLKVKRYSLEMRRCFWEPEARAAIPKGVTVLCL